MKPFVRPSAAESPALRPIAPVFGRVTLPPFGPIRYGGPKPGAAVVDDEAPSWTSIDELAPAPAQSTSEWGVPPHTPPEPASPVSPLLPEPASPVTPVRPESASPVTPLSLEPASPVTAVPPERASPVTPVVAEGEAEAELPLPETVQHEVPAWLDAAPPEPEPEPEPEPQAWEPMMRRPALPLTGPNDPTPIVNQTIERYTEPHRMTPMRVTPLRPAAIPAPSVGTADGNARAIAAALELIAARVRRGDLVVGGSMPTNDDPPALAAALAATLAALLGVRN